MENKNDAKSTQEVLTNTQAEPEVKTEPEKTPEKANEPTPEMKEVMAEVEKLKKALSKSNSEAAENKRKYLASLDEAQRAEAERAEKEAEKDRLLAEYMEKERFSSYKSKLMEAGIDAKTAELMAKSLPDGVKDEYFDAVKTFNGNQKQAFEAQDLTKQPGLSVGMPPVANKKSDFDAALDKAFGL